MAKSIQARIDILVDAAKAQAALKRVTRETDKFNRSTQRVKGNPFKSVTRSVAGLAGAYIGAQGLITVLQSSVREQQESIKVGRQTNAVLKSTKGAAGLTAKAVGDLAEKLSEKTAIDDEAIQSAENLLLTFTKIGKDTFPAATQAVLDLSVATGTSLKGASLQVGKALQDPVKGVLALKKAGVDLNPALRKNIENLVKTGKTAEAQKLILKELAIEFGGSAKAQATPLDQLKRTYENLLETIGGYLVPVLNDVATATMKFVEQFRQGKGAGGEFRDTLKSIYDTLKPIVAFLINHPQVVAGAAAAYIAFKATLAALNLFNTLMVAYGSIAQYVGAGTARGAAFARGLGLGLAIGLPVALLGIADTISQALLPKNLPSQMESAFGFTGSIQQRFAKWWANLKRLSAAGFAYLRDGAVTLGAVFFSNVRNSIVQSLGAVSSAFKRMKSVASSVFDYVGGIAKDVGNAIRSAFEFAKGGVDALVNAIARVKRAVEDLPGAGALKKLAQAVGARSANPNRVSASGGVRAAMPFGLGTEVGNTQELLAAQFAAANVEKRTGAKTKKGKAAQQKANERAQARADNRVAAIEAKQAAKQARATAGETLKGFVAGILDQVRETKLAEIMAPVNTARAKRAADAITAGKASITRKMGAESRDANGNLLPGSPAAMKYAREGARLDARIIQARRQGNLEAIDSLQNEKDALDARYGPAYLSTLRDELAQLNEDEIEASSETAAKAFAATFSTGLNEALDVFLKGGTVEGFFTRLKTALTGSGVAPGDLPASVTGGVGEAAAVLSGTTMAGKPVAGGIKTWNQRISELVRTLNKKTTHKASDVAKALGTTQKNVWANRLPLPSGHKMDNKVSGGYLTPGALTLVGETGPELIVGGKVMSATRTNRMGGGQGMNITVNAVGAAADDPMLLARQLGWQLATR